MAPPGDMHWVEFNMSSIAVAQHALTKRSKGQRSRSHGNKNCHGRTVASDACCYGRVLLLPAWVCMSIRLPVLSIFNYHLDNEHILKVTASHIHCKCGILGNGGNSAK